MITICKTYKEACSFLKEDTKSGASKRAQLARWDREWILEKSGREFTFISRKEKPDKQLRQIRKDSSTTENFLIAFLSFLENLKQANPGKTHIYLTKNDIMEAVILTSSEFFTENGSCFVTEEILTGTKDDILTYKATRDSFKDILANLRDVFDNAYKSMLSRKIIHIEKTWLVVTDINEYEPEYSIKTQITEIVGVALSQYNCSHIGEVYAIGKQKEFYSYINGRLTEKFDIKSFREVYKVPLNDTLTEVIEAIINRAKETSRAKLELIQHISTKVHRQMWLNIDRYTEKNALILSGKVIDIQDSLDTYLLKYKENVVKQLKLEQLSIEFVI